MSDVFTLLFKNLRTALSVVQRRLISLVWVNDEQMHEDLKHFNHAAALHARIAAVLPRRLTREDIVEIRDIEEVDAILARARRLYDIRPSDKGPAAASNRRQLYQSKKEVHAAAEAELVTALFASKAANLFKSKLKKCNS